jgi:uncharacterized membrane protein (DUF373 family)
MTSLVQPFGLQLRDIWTRGIRLVLSLLIFTILIALASGVVETLWDVRLIFQTSVERALRRVIVDTLMLLAVVEVLKTILTYFSEGRVKVTFIVDTILIVMLTEVISEWFKGPRVRELLVLGGVLLALGLIRAMTVKYSPAQTDLGAEIVPATTTH